MIESVQNDPVSVENVSSIQVSSIQEEVPEMRKAGDEATEMENMETDAQSASDGVCVPSSTPEGISTPEQCLTPRGPNGEPLLWCGMPPVPQIEGMAQVPRIEGWMAVAVPAEFAPPGAPGPFDGLWKNGEDERIVIDHEEILFESG